MKTLEHEIRDVLSGKDLEELTFLEEFIDYAAENYVITEEDEQYLVELAPLLALGGIALGTGARALLGGIIRNAPRIGQAILKSLKRGGKRSKILSRRLSRAAKRRRGAAGLAAGAAAAAAGGGGGADGATNGHKDVDHSTITQSHGPRGKTIKIMVDSVIVESREDIEATPRFTETDRKKIDVVPRAENDLETANRKRFRLENIKKKIIDESLNIRHEFNNFLIEENIELTEEEYDEAFDILFQYFVQDLNENTVSNIYKGAKKTLGFVGKKVLAPALYASDAYEKYKKGDTSGALTSGAKAVASATPYGAAASIAHDAYEARKDITDIGKRAYNYVRKSLLGKPKPSNQISQKKRKPIGLQRTGEGRVTKKQLPPLPVRKPKKPQSVT